MRPINWDTSHPHPDVQLPLPVLSTCPVCLGSSHSQVLWGICNEDRELAPGRPGPSLWVEHPSQKWNWGWVSHSLDPQPKLPGGLTAVSLLLPNPRPLPFPPQSWEPVVDHTHTAQRSPGCVAGNPACSLLGRCSVQSPQLSPGEAPGPGFWSPQGWTERGFGPPGSNSVWQEDGCRQHRGGAGTGLAGLSGARYFHVILRPKRRTERGGNRYSERDKEG